MGDRLNDTAAVVGMVPYESQSEHYSRTVRKIDNGFLTTHRAYGANCPDGPTDKEVFTRDHPDMKDASEMGRDGNAMRRAVEFMNKK